MDLESPLTAKRELGSRLLVIPPPLLWCLILMVARILQKWEDRLTALDDTQATEIQTQLYNLHAVTSSQSLLAQDGTREK